MNAVETQLRGGQVTYDPRLDRLVHFDERSRQHPVRAALEAAGVEEPRSYEWHLPLRLNQGTEGACPGFAVTHEAGCEPEPIQGLTNDDAFAVYHRAQELDEWPGEDYSGSSVLAALKASVERGWISEYKWAFGLQDLVLAVGWHGPAVLGINWYEGMEQTDNLAHVHVEGEVVGGHAICCNAVDLENFGGRFKLTNSWGEDWGWYGTCWVSFDDMERLLHEQGEAALPAPRVAA